MTPSVGGWRLHHVSSSFGLPLLHYRSHSIAQQLTALSHIGDPATRAEGRRAIARIAQGAIAGRQATATDAGIQLIAQAGEEGNPVIQIAPPFRGHG